MVLLSLSNVPLMAQLVWNQQMDRYSVVVPLTLDNNVYRIRAKPPEGVKPSDISCDIGITGTVLTDQRGTSPGDPGEKVATGLMSHDDIDVQFADRVYTGYHNLVGDRIIRKYDLDCGINIKYQNLKNVAQVEIRVGYVLPSGDIEGLTWAKLRRKQRIFQRNLQKCARFRSDIRDLESQYRVLVSSGSNHVERSTNQARAESLKRKADRMQKFVSREQEFERDLAAFQSLNEYLKTKVHGCQVFVHFHYEGETLPADLDDLKRSHVRPIQVFEEGKDPILARQQ